MTTANGASRHATDAEKFGVIHATLTDWPGRIEALIEEVKAMRGRMDAIVSELNEAHDAITDAGNIGGVGVAHKHLDRVRDQFGTAQDLAEAEMLLTQWLEASRRGQLPTGAAPQFDIAAFETRNYFARAKSRRKDGGVL